jgi:hypothetical protein
MTAARAALRQDERLEIVRDQMECVKLIRQAMPEDMAGQIYATLGEDDPRHPPEAALAVLAAYYLPTFRPEVAAWAHEMIVDFVIRDLTETRSTWACLTAVAQHLAEYLDAMGWRRDRGGKWVAQ